MTTYGTIPSSSSPSTNLDFILRAKEKIKAGLLNYRPWKIMFNFRSFGIPHGEREVLSRILVNIRYFWLNYLILLNLGLFVYCLNNPIFIIVFAVYLACLLYWLFLRDEPLVILGHPINAYVMMFMMAVLSVVLLLSMMLNMLLISVLSLRWFSTQWMVALEAAAVTVDLHVILRKTDDLLSDEELAAVLAEHDATVLAEYDAAAS